MRFSAPVPAASEPPTPVASSEPLSLPAMRARSSMRSSTPLGTSPRHFPCGPVCGSASRW